ncbi:MAG: hypothetical protein NC453_10275 [Muribaculum sp.]|nr:hypothetical protein [Muribaculum sp.]
MTLNDFIANYTEYGSRGEYGLGFLHLKVSFPIDINRLNELSKENLGTFAHEYIHYLQNLSTPLGIWQAMHIYSYLSEFFKFVQTSPKPISIPFTDFTPSDALISREELYKEIDGERSFFKIQKEKPFFYKRNPFILNGRKIERILLHATKADGCDIEFILGAKIIKESMAALIQETINPTSKNEHEDVPYNVVALLAEKYFPNICNDVRKLASICFISLFTLSPGITLINYLSYANDNPSNDIGEIFTHFLNDSKALTSDGKILSIAELSSDIVEKFKIIIHKLLYGNEDIPLDFIGEVIDRVKVSNGLVPLLRLLMENDISAELLQEAVSVCGTPIIYNDNGYLSLPMSAVDVQNNNQEASKDISLLSAYWSLFSKLTDSRYYVCPMNFMCNANGTPFKDECYETPWDGEVCMMTLVARTCGLTN